MFSALATPDTSAMQIPDRFSRRIFILSMLLAVIAVSAALSSQAQELQLSRSARPWEFFCAIGSRAGLFGNEAGNLEAWVYPLKIFRNFHLNFLTEGRSLPAETLGRTVSVRPESSTIIYSSDTFSVKETLFVPVHDPGALIIFEVETAQPLEIEVAFERDFALEWPAGLGGTYVDWEPKLRTFYFGEERRKYVAFVGSPSADHAEVEYQTNYSASAESRFWLGATQKGREWKVIPIVASVYVRSERTVAYKSFIEN